MKTNVRGINLAYDDQGSGSAVVLLHGYPFNRSMWDEQVDVLKNHYRVITADLRGHGESQTTPTASMEEMAVDVASLLDTLGISWANIGGLSMGGYVALAFYRNYPSRVRSLVLADTRAQADTEEAKKTRAEQAEKALAEGMEGIADAFLKKLLAPETVVRRPELVKRIREMMVQMKPEGAAAALRGMAQRQDQRPFLNRIVSPTLIIVGREDTITPVEDAEAIHHAVRGSRLKIIEGASHVSNLEKPAEFSETLLEFLQELD